MSLLGEAGHKFHDAATAAADGKDLDVLGWTLVAIKVTGASGLTSASISFLGAVEKSPGTNTFDAVDAFRVDDSTISQTFAVVAGEDTIFMVSVAGLTKLRVDLTAITAGSGSVSVEGAMVTNVSSPLVRAVVTAPGLDTTFDGDGDNTAQAGKASATGLHHIECSNPNSADAYLQLFDLATGSVTVGTTVPKLSLLVPAGDGTKDGAMDKFFGPPIKFGTALTYACTTTATGSGDPTTGLIVNLAYT
jgi:hypothetical protein